MAMHRSVSSTTVALLLILTSREILSLEDDAHKPNQDLDKRDGGFEAPLVLVVLLARNKELNLPYFLTFFERLSYPKKRMLLHIRADTCVDGTIDILEDWLSVNQELYSFVDVVLNRSSTKPFNLTEGYELTDETIKHIVYLKEEALANARKLLVDYVLFLDVDVYLTNPDVISNLIGQNITVVAPMLDSINFYSNFWDFLTNEYWTTSSVFYSEILFRLKKGCFQVPIIHSCFLINIKEESTDQITFNPMDERFLNLPNDDIITFGSSVLKAGLSSYICNDERSGYVENDLTTGDTPAHIQYRFKELQVTMARYEPISSLTTVSPVLAKYIEPAPTIRDRAGLSEIYYINLKRRPSRRARMEFLLEELGLEGRRVDAVDGRDLNQTYLDAMGIKVMNGYQDPYEIRKTLTMGEVGCFLSHYNVWKDVIEKGHNSVMILEDDVHFNTNFKVSLIKAQIQLVGSRRSWDFVYLGRLFLKYEEEYPVNGMSYFVHAGLSYWLVGYLLSQSGAKKLVQAEPLSKMLPADEYVPLMYNRPHKSIWALEYPKRNLIAYALTSSILEPQHFNVEHGYISDTEGVEGIRFINGTDRAKIPVAPNVEEAEDIGGLKHGGTDDFSSMKDDHIYTSEEASYMAQLESCSQANEGSTTSADHVSYSEREDNKMLMSILLGLDASHSSEIERCTMNNKNPFTDSTLS